MDSANRIDWTWPIGVFALVAVTSVANAQSYADVFPDRNWQRSDTPEQRGWSGDKLRAARAYADTINTAAVIIVDDGIVVDEWGETDRKFNVHSVRKSLLSAMIGIFEEQGTLNLENTLEDLSIDDRLGLTADERQATLADLLGSRSGVYHPANLVGEQLSARWPERGSHDPGTYWFYSNWDFNVTGAIFEKETGRGIFEAFDQLIAKPTGMVDFVPRDGMYEPRSGWGGAQGRSVSDYPAYIFRMSARDMARFGLLYLRGGRWKDRQVVPREWVERTTMTDRPAGNLSGHEFFWWISIEGRLYPGVDVGKGAFAAKGAGGHYITVMPEYKTVVVHRVNTNDRTVPVGGTNEGTRVSSAEHGKLLSLILAARP
jgi:CubicO group peptidase (beta-lactamase class C family)